MLKLINEEVIEIIPDKDDELDTKETVVDAENNEKVDDQISTNASEAVILDLVKNVWETVGSVNSAIATLDYSYDGDQLEDIKAILTSIVDDLTIDIGMLYKISDMMNNKTEQLLDAGAEKAENLTQE